MPENSNSDNLSQLLSGILKNAGVDSTPSSAANSSEKSGLSLPPELLEKLPQVMSVLSGMGIGEPDTSPEKKDNSLSPSPSHGHAGNRKALLRALRPYLSPRRQAVIDSLMSFEGLSGILENLPVIQKKEEKQ